MRTQLLAFFATADMEAAAKVLAARLEEKLPARLASQLQQAIRDNKAQSNEHGLMGTILEVLSGNQGPCLLLQCMPGRHLASLLTDMGRDASGMHPSECERAIMQIWADQVKTLQCSLSFVWYICAAPHMGSRCIVHCMWRCCRL